MTTKPDEDFPCGPSNDDILFARSVWNHGWAEGYKADIKNRKLLMAAIIKSKEALEAVKVFHGTLPEDFGDELNQAISHINAALKME